MRDVQKYKRELLEQSMLVTPKVAAEILSCSERTVYRLVDDGDLRAYSRYPHRRGLRILASDLREYVRSIRREVL